MWLVTLALLASARAQPSEQSPIAAGVVVDTLGQRAGGASVVYRLLFRGGGQLSTATLAQRDGSFTIALRARDERKPEDVVGGDVWAHREGEVSPLVELARGGKRLRLALQHIATLRGVLDFGQTRRAPTTVTARVLSPTSVLRSQNIFWSKEITVSERQFDLGYVPSGRVQLEAQATDGRAGFTEIAVAPGQNAQARIAMARRGAMLLVPHTTHPERFIVLVYPGAGMSARAPHVAQVGNGEGAEFEGLLNGEHTVVVLDSRGFESVHKVTVEPDVRWQYDLRFLVALGQGKVGLLLETAGALVRVKEVVPGSPAEGAGIQPGDIVVSVAGRAVSSAAAAVEVLAGEAGTNVEMTIRRGRSERRVKLTRSRGQ